MRKTIGIMVVMAVLMSMGWVCISHAGVTLKVADIGNPHAYQADKILPDFEQLTGTKMYDIYTVDVPWFGEFVPFMEPLTGYVDQSLETTEGRELLALDDYPPRVLESFNWKGTQYMLPIGSNILMLYYRKDLFEQQGTAVAQTPEEYMEVAQKLTKDDFWGTVMNGQTVDSSDTHGYVFRG